MTLPSLPHNPPLANSPNPLLDVQNTPDNRGIALDRVGIKNVEIPMTVMQKDGQSQTVAATATMSVGLAKEIKGTHMSRFVSQLTEWSRGKTLSLDFKGFLEEARSRLHAPSAQIELDFRYFIDKPAPVTQITAPMAYGCSFEASLERNNDYRFILGVQVPVSTLCPCSKAISDYGAHNQRADIVARVVIDTAHEEEQSILWIEDLIAALEECGSCPVYPFLKRADEKYVTERQYDNPKFVEDVVRDATTLLRTFPGVSGFSVSVEALESIHGHNAWAAHTENFLPDSNR